MPAFCIRRWRRRILRRRAQAEALQSVRERHGEAFCMYALTGDGDSEHLENAPVGELSAKKERQS